MDVDDDRDFRNVSLRSLASRQERLEELGQKGSAHGGGLRSALTDSEFLAEDGENGIGRRSRCGLWTFSERLSTEALEIG